MPKDMLGREVKVDDYVVSYNNLYQVQAVFNSTYRHQNLVTIKLLDPSKTTKPLKRSSNEVCVLPADDVLIWLLTRKAA